MNSYDAQMLYAYLLGSLPNEDTERLDEMTFTDTDFVDQVNAAEKDLVDSYVTGDLSGDMLKSFESHYLVSPNRRKNVMFAKALQDHAERGKRTPAAHLAMASAGKSTGFFESLAAWWSSSRPVFQLASAAVALAVVGLGGWMLMRGLNGNGGQIASGGNQNNIVPVNTVFPPATATPTPAPLENRAVNSGTNIKSPANTNSPSPTPAPKKETDEPRPQIAAITLLPPLRGGEKLPQLQLKPETSAASFTLNLEPGNYSSYKVSLVDQGSGRRVWQATPKARGEGNASLSLTIPAKLLNPQVYSFSVSGITKDGVSENIGDYPFRIVR